MSHPKPTPYEIARIAAALDALGAKKDPSKAIKEALALWNAAAAELADDQATEKAEVPPPSDILAMIIADAKAGSNQAEIEEEAFRWVKSQPGGTDIKTIGGFRKAWKSFCFEAKKDFTEVPDNPNLWEEFLDFRRGNKLRRDAKRKRASRLKQKRGRNSPGQRGGKKKR